MQDCSEIAGVLGVDLSDKKLNFCLLNREGSVVSQGQCGLTKGMVGRLLGRELNHLECDGRLRVILEAGTHSRWVSELCKSLGHEAIVANPRELPAIFKSTRKNDANDAEKLARIGRADPSLLSPIRHRGYRAQVDLAQLRVRDGLVRARTQLINMVRGIVKPIGEEPLPSCSTRTFHRQVAEFIPDDLRPALEPVLPALEELSRQIAVLDKQIAEMCEQKYPETDALRQVPGVGPITSLAFVLVLEDARHFKNGRTVGAYLGLTPRQDDSGDTRKQLRVTKQGDEHLRWLLVQSAQYILGRFGPDTDLRRWGMTLAERGGKNAKRRAVVAVARKLAVLLHSLWRTGEVYEPLRNPTKKSPTDDSTKKSPPDPTKKSPTTVA